MYGCMDRCRRYVSPHIDMYGCMYGCRRCVPPYMNMDGCCVPPYMCIGTAHMGVREGVTLLHVSEISLSYP